MPHPLTHNHYVMNSANAQCTRARASERDGYSTVPLSAMLLFLLLNPVSEANADEHDFLVTLVRPGYRFGTEAASASSQLP